MRYVQSKDGVFVRHIIDTEPTRFDEDTYSFVRHLTDEQMARLGVTKLTFVTPPGFDPLTQSQAEGDAVLVDGKWCQNWVVTDLNPEEGLARVRSLRAAEYPPITDYIDGVVKGDQAQVQAYIDACLAVKAKYPKPA